MANQVMHLGTSWGTPAYTGPGDIVSGATFWGGLRAYSAATIGTNCVRLIRASDSAQQNFVTLANGSVDLASITTFLAATTGKVVTLFDQSGNGNDATQATDLNRPDFTFNAIGSLPGITFDKGNPEFLRTPSITAATQPYSISAVAKRTGDFTSYNTILGCNNGLYFNNTANNVMLYGGILTGLVAATDSTMHGIQAVINGASSIGNIDGSGTTVDAGTDATASATWEIGANGSGGSGLTGIVCEAGLWKGLAFSAGNNTALFSNQDAYWIIP